MQEVREGSMMRYWREYECFGRISAKLSGGSRGKYRGSRKLLPDGSMVESPFPETPFQVNFVDIESLNAGQ